MLSRLDAGFTVLATAPAADSAQLAILRARYPNFPDDYLRFVQVATEVELHHVNGSYVRIWGPDGCVEMDDGYGISERIPGAIPIGDAGGGNVLLSMNGAHGPGLYIVGYGDLDADDARFVASGLQAFLERGVGIDSI